MLRSSSCSQETSWFHFHKIAAGGHEVYAPPMDMQQVYYQMGMPEMRNNCYQAPDPRSSYTQIPPQNGFPPEVRPPSQMVNQRFVQCVNHFAPGSRSMPCLLQPSYYSGCRYDFGGGPVQTGSESMLTRMDTCEVSRPQRYQHPDMPIYTRANQDQNCYKQPWDFEQVCQSFLPRYPENPERKGKKSYFDSQDQKNRDKGIINAFSCLAAEVSAEMQEVIASGGIALSDLMDFCKFVQAFLVSSNTTVPQRNQCIREIVLSFIHLSSSYVHLSSVIQIAEQFGIIQNEIEGLKTSFSCWETAATSVINSLRELVNSMSEIKNKMHETEEQNSFKSEPPGYYPNAESPFLNINIGESSGFRLAYSRNHNRTEVSSNQQFEIKRKYQYSNCNTPKEPPSQFCPLNPSPNKNINLKTKNCNQLNLQHGNGSSKSQKGCYQHCISSGSCDSDKTKTSDNQDIKNFCFELLNQDKKKFKGKIPSDQEKEQSIYENRMSDYEAQEAFSREIKENAKKAECSRTLTQIALDNELMSTQNLEDSVFNRLSRPTSHSRIEEWSFGVLSTGNKKSFNFTQNEDETKIADSNDKLKEEVPEVKIPLMNVDEAEKPMSPDGDGYPQGRFSNPELNKALEEHCEAARIQLKHKMLDILSFLQTPDLLCDSSADIEMNELKKTLQENLHRISYLVYTDQYKGVGEMLNSVRSLFHKTRVQYLTNVKAMRLADELETNFHDLFKKEFGCCSVLYPQSKET